MTELQTRDPEDCSFEGRLVQGKPWLDWLAVDTG